MKHTNTDQPSRLQRRCSFFASVPRSVFLFTPQHAFFCFEFALFKWINSLEQYSPAYLSFKLHPPFFFMSNGVTCLGKWPGQTYFFFEKQNKEKVIYDFFWYVYFKVWIFFIVKILVLCLEYPVFLFLFFWRNVINILIYQICFLVCCIRPIP